MRSAALSSSDSSGGSSKGPSRDALDRASRRVVRCIRDVPRARRTRWAARFLSPRRCGKTGASRRFIRSRKLTGDGCVVVPVFGSAPSVWPMTWSFTPRDIRHGWIP
jgi:hypothetical protein